MNRPPDSPHPSHLPSNLPLWQSLTCLLLEHKVGKCLKKVPQKSVKKVSQKSVPRKCPKSVQKPLWQTLTCLLLKPGSWKKDFFLSAPKTTLTASCFPFAGTRCWKMFKKSVPKKCLKKVSKKCPKEVPKKCKEKSVQKISLADSHWPFAETQSWKKKKCPKTTLTAFHLPFAGAQSCKNKTWLAI